MAGRFTQNFSLTDIFNNKKLKNKIPLINYKEKELENGKISRRTNAKTINRLVFDISTSAARPFYKPIKTHRAGNRMEIGGNLVGDHNSAVEAVYNALISQKQVMIYTVNNADMIRSALKEAEKNKRKYGIDTKLKLRAQSMQEIEGMSKRQIQALLSDIMENIVYGDNFPETQKKYGVENLPVKSPYNYKQRQQIWKNKVGD
ncbi:MAG: hypothetical protein IJF83_01330 [Methanobrevibacter sp.]|nr:hypothetical protein [Methanobrevibacter sp.]